MDTAFALGWWTLHDLRVNDIILKAPLRLCLRCCADPGLWNKVQNAIPVVRKATQPQITKVPQNFTN